MGEKRIHADLKQGPRDVQIDLQAGQHFRNSMSATMSYQNQLNTQTYKVVQVIPGGGGRHMNPMLNGVQYYGQGYPQQNPYCQVNLGYYPGFVPPTHIQNNMVPHG